MSGHDPHGTGPASTVPVPTVPTGAPVSRPLRAGLVLVGLLLVAANLRASITSVGPVLAMIRDQQQLSSAAASILVSLPVIAFAVFSPLAPALASRLGLERALGIALATLGVGIVLRSVPPQPLLWVGTALLGFGIAVLNVLLPSLIKRDFPTRIGPLTGAYTAVQTGFAALAAGFAVPLVGQNPDGWRISIGIWAGLALIALAVFAPQLRRTAAHYPTHHTARRVRAPWRNALAWQITGFLGLQSLAFYVLVAWLSAIEHAAGISPTIAGYHQLLLNLCALIASLVCCALLHRLGDHRLLAAVGSLLLIAAYVGLLLAPGLGGLWAALAGLSGGITLVLALSLFGLRTRTHPEAAALSGMAQTVGYTIAALGPIGIGILHDATGGWTVPLLVLTAAAIAQTILGILAARPRLVTWPIGDRAAAQGTADAAGPCNTPAGPSPAGHAPNQEPGPGGDAPDD